MLGYQDNEATTVVAVEIVVKDIDVETVTVTGINCGVLTAPTAATVIVVEYVPAASPAMFAVAVNQEGVVPETEESASHGAAVLTLQSNVPAPESEMDTVCAAGSLPP